jgi:PAS domain S-box-containing protein
MKALFVQAHIEDEEQKRIALIALVTAVASLSGLSLLLIYRMLTGQPGPMLSFAILGALIVASIVFLRNGRIGWSGGLLTWSLLGFLDVMIWKYDGLHDTAVVAIPGVLVLASLVLKRKHYITVTIVILSSIAMMGYLELAGAFRIAKSTGTTALDIIDLLVILGVTAITVRSLSDALTKSLESVTNSEKEMRVQATRLRLSEDRYRMLFEGANDAILIMNGERFVDCNIMSVRMFGYEGSEDIIGRSPWELSPSLQPDGSDSREKALAILRNALRGEPQRFLWNHSRKDGTLFDAEVSLSRLEAGNEILIQALVRDVTERKQMEDRLRKSEEYYRTLVETSPEAIVIIDAGGHLVFASQKAHDLFGTPRSQSIVGRSMLHWVAPEHHTIVQARMREALAGELNPYSREYRLLKEDRTEFLGEIASSPLFDAWGHATGLLLVCHDVSERRAAEKALRESEERFSRLSNASFEGIVLSQRGRVIDLNDQLADMLLYKRSEMVGMDVLDFVAPESREIVLQHLRSGAEEPYEHMALRRDGSTFPVEVRAKSVPSNGDTIRLTAVRDITGRKEAEKQLVVSLREKEILLKEIHHRVKNNMQVISSLLNLGNQKITDTPAKEVLHASMNRIRSMALVHEALYRSENMADIDFSEYLRNMTSWLLHSSGRLGITFLIGGDSVHLPLDTAIPCGLIANELVSNALKHAFQGRDTGTIDISLDRPSNGIVTLTIRDDGVGIPPGTDIRTMSSLGMALVFSLVDQISGTITLDGEKGTGIVVSFPA